MSETLELLKDEHRLIERGLRALEAVCERLEGGERVPVETLVQLLDFIRSFADGFHHAKEEGFLFPALVERGIPCVGGPIGCMLYEHDLGRRLVAEMTTSTDDYNKGDETAAGRFVASSRSYIQLLTQHIQKEDDVLFKMAARVLDAEALTSLAKAFEEAEAELGPTTRADCERVISELESAWVHQPV